jgi:hypothetical protein
MAHGSIFNNEIVIYRNLSYQEALRKAKPEDKYFIKGDDECEGKFKVVFLLLNKYPDAKDNKNVIRIYIGTIINKLPMNINSKVFIENGFTGTLQLKCYNKESLNIAIKNIIDSEPSFKLETAWNSVCTPAVYNAKLTFNFIHILTKEKES